MSFTESVSQVYYRLVGPDEPPEGSPVRKRVVPKQEQTGEEIFQNQNGEVIIDYGISGSNEFYQNQELYYYLEETDEGGGGGGRVEHIVITQIYDSLYYKSVGLTAFCHQYREQMIECYDKHSVYSPLKLGITKGELSRRQLRGLEYLTNPFTMKKEDEKLQFPQIHFSEKEAACALEGVEDTFRVRRTFDYIFSHLIEQALLGPVNNENPLISDGVRRMRVYYRDERMRIYQHNQCLTNHDHSRCPYEWVIYTKKTSAFFLYCREILSRNPLITYEEDDGYLGISPVSFLLVSFLCGPFQEPTISITPENFQLVEGYDEWVQVPIFFLDLYSTRVSLSI